MTNIGIKIAKADLEEKVTLTDKDIFKTCILEKYMGNTHQD